MTDAPLPSDAPISNPYEELKNEMASQMNELRASFESYRDEKEKELSQLKEDNKNLQRALIRETFSPSETPKQEPTEEELYRTRILSRAERSLELMKQR